MKDHANKLGYGFIVLFVFVLLSIFIFFHHALNHAAELEYLKDTKTVEHKLYKWKSTKNEPKNNGWYLVYHSTGKYYKIVKWKDHYWETKHGKLPNDFYSHWTELKEPENANKTSNK